MAEAPESFDKAQVITVLRAAQADGEARGFAFALGTQPADCVFLTDKRQEGPKLLVTLKKDFPGKKKVTSGSLTVADGKVYLSPKKVLSGIAKQLRKRFKLEGLAKYDLVLLDEFGNVVVDPEDQEEPTDTAIPQDPTPDAPDPRALTYARIIAGFAKQVATLPGDQQGPLLTDLRGIRELLQNAGNGPGLAEVGQALATFKAKLAAVPDTGTAPDVTAQAEKAAKMLGPRVLSAIKADPDRRAELGGLLKAVATAKDAPTLREAVQALKIALGQSATPGGLSIKALGQARLEWDTVRAEAFTGAETVKKVISAVYAEDPDAAGAVKEALGKLDTALSRLALDLRNDLDAVLNAPTPEAAKPGIETARKRVETFLKLTEADPVLSTLDHNEFTPDLKVIAPLRANLSNISAALGA